MKSRVENALELQKNKYNCSQAVLCSYADLLGVSHDTAFKVSEGFGGGIGGMHEVCGAVTGLTMAVGLANSTGENGDKLSKAKTYKITREMTEKFKEKNQSIICRDLLGVGTGGKLRSCQGCIADACVLLEEELFKGKFEKFYGNVE